MKTKTVLAALLLASTLALAGCIENMRDLKDRIGAEEPVQPAATAAADEPAAALNNTTQLRPPVARIAVFGANGALLYKAPFKADDEATPILVEDNATLRLMASDSEALQPGAKLVSFTWTVKDQKLEGRQVDAKLEGAGLYPVSLVVADSNGKTDMQNLTLAVAPKPFDVVTKLTTGPVIGAEHHGQAGEAAFELTAAAAGVPATIVSVRFVATPPATCDPTFDVVGPDGESVGSKDDGGLGGEESITSMAPAEGKYAITVGPLTCIAHEGVPITVTVTYLPHVDGLGELGDGHGGHAH